MPRENTTAGPGSAHGGGRVWWEGGGTQGDGASHGSAQQTQTLQPDSAKRRTYKLTSSGTVAAVAPMRTAIRAWEVGACGPGGTC